MITEPVRWVPVPDPALRIFLFHPGGQSHSLFTGWYPHFPPDWEVLAVDLPGHGTLANVPPLTEPNALVDHVHHIVVQYAGRPFAFFGHSMGAAIAYDVARRLEATPLASPAWIGLSAMAPPRAVAGFDRLPRDPLARRRVLAPLVLLGQPHHVLDNGRAWQAFSAAFDADLGFMEHWFSQPPARLQAPVSLFAGRADRLFTAAAIEEWMPHLGCALGLHWFPGGHSYLTKTPSAIIRRILTDISVALSPRFISINAITPGHTESRSGAAAWPRPPGSSSAATLAADTGGLTHTTG